MKKKIKILFGIILAVLALSAAACKRNEDIPETESSNTEIPSQRSVRIIGLQGPTGMGLAKLIHDENEYDISIISSGEMSSIAGKILNNECDICAVPINLASVLFNKTEGKIKIIGAATEGVLYMLDGSGEIGSIADLRGKTIYATGQGSTPEYILKYILSKSGIDPDKDAKIEFIQDHTELAALMASDIYSVGMLPEPNVTAVTSANPNIKKAIDLTEEWEKISSGEKLIQGVLIARADFANNDPKLIEKFLNDYEESVDFINNNINEAAKYIVEAKIIPNEKTAEKAIPSCNIVCGKEDSYNDILSCLNVLFEANPASVGGKLPEKGDLFHYAEK